MPIQDIAQFDISEIDLNLLPVLMVLLEERSVTRAAQRLHVTQSTVSGMLARLREGLGDPLFIRTQHGITPTPRAAALSAPLRAWLLEAHALIAPAEFDPSQWQSSVALAATDHTQHVLLRPLTRLLREQAPHLRVAVHSLIFKDVGERLARGEFDLAISARGWVPADLPSLPLFEERYVLGMSAKHPLARKRRVTLNQFCQSDHIIVSPSGGAFDGPVDETLSKLGRRRSVRLSVPSFAVLPDVLAASDLLCIAPERLLRDRPDIHIGAAPFKAPKVQMVAVWHPSVSDDDAHSWLREKVVEVARGI